MTTENKSTGKGKGGKYGRRTVEKKAGKFDKLADNIDIAGIRELSKSDPEAAYMATQQLEQQLLQEEAAHNAKAAELPQESSDNFENESKTEKGLELQAQLPFDKKQQLKNVQELKTEIENTLRARALHTATPKPGA